MNREISNIINNSRNANEAWRSYNAYRLAGHNIDSGEFTRAVNNRWPISGTNTGAGYTGNNGGGNTGNNGGGITNFFGNMMSTLNDGFKLLPTLTEKYYRTQFGQNTSLSGEDSDKGSKILELLKNNGLNIATLTLNSLSTIQDEIIDQLTRESQLKSDINSKTTLTLKLSEDVRQDILESSINAAKYGFTINEVSELYSGLVEKSGKFSLINKETMDLAAPVARSLSLSMGELSDTINEFEKVGTGANKTIETIFEASKKSITLGLSGKKTVTDMQMSIGKLNEYGFKNGIQGLSEMVRKSNEFRISMEETFKIADKVMSPEGALELTANLQVLGGAIGDFNDPLKLMYMATNNVEGLQDALIGAAGSLATYNKEQGRFEITGVNLRKAKEMATQLGVSYQELAKGAIAAAERSSAAAAIMSTGLQMKSEDKEFLTNLSRMEGGEMVIKVPESIAQKLGVPTQIALDQLDQKTANALLENKKDFEKLNPEQMAMAQLTETQKMAGYLQTIAAYYKNRGAKIARGTMSGTGIDGMIMDKYKDVENYSKEISQKKSDPNFQKRVEGTAKEMTNDYIIKPIEKAKEYWEDPGKLFDDLKEEIKGAIKDGFEMIKGSTSFNQPKQRITIESNITTSNPGDYLTTKNIKNV